MDVKECPFAEEGHIGRMDKKISSAFIILTLRNFCPVEGQFVSRSYDSPSACAPDGYAKLLTKPGTVLNLLKWNKPFEAKPGDGRFKFHLREKYDFIKMS